MELPCLLSITAEMYRFHMAPWRPPAPPRRPSTLSSSATVFSYSCPDFLVAICWIKEPVEREEAFRKSELSSEDDTTISDVDALLPFLCFLDRFRSFFF